MVDAAARPTVSVVICAYSEARWAQLREAIGSAHAQLGPDDELILVVDHNDSLQARAAAMFDGAMSNGATVLANRYSTGASGGRNTGAEAASRDILVFLDDDAAAQPGWLSTLLRWYVDPTVVAVGGSAYPVWEGGRRPWWTPPSFDWVVGCTYDGQPTQPTPVRNVWACNMSVRRSAFEAVGGFREAIGGLAAGVTRGCEETELCIRLGGRGSVLYDPTSSVLHFVPTSRQTFGYFRHRCYLEGKSKYLVARVAGHRTATSAESTYTRAVIARCAAQLWRGITRLDRTNLSQGVVAMTGLILAVAGYLGSWLRRSP